MLRDKLLTAVDVVCRARHRLVTHDMNGERCDVGRLDDTPDRQNSPQLFTPLFKIVAQQRRRELRIDEAGRDQVHAGGGQFEGPDWR